MAISVTKPTVGGSEDSWGTTINDGLDTIVNAVNGTSGTVAPNLTTLTIGSQNVTSTVAELNKLDGFTGTVADLNYAKDLRATGVTDTEFNKLDGLTATASELNKLDGANVTTTELNYLDNVTSNVQTQLNAKADEASPSFTGTVGLPENWSFSISGTGASSKLVFAYNGTAVMSISAAGALVTDDNITAFGTP